MKTKEGFLFSNNKPYNPIKHLTLFTEKNHSQNSPSFDGSVFIVNSANKVNQSNLVSKVKKANSQDFYSFYIPEDLGKFEKVGRVLSGPFDKEILVDICESKLLNSRIEIPRLDINLNQKVVNKETQMEYSNNIQKH